MTILPDHIASADASGLRERVQLADTDSSPSAASRQQLPPGSERTGAINGRAESRVAAALWSGRGALELFFAITIALLTPVVCAAFWCGAYDVVAVLFGPLFCACWALCLCDSLDMRN